MEATDRAAEFIPAGPLHGVPVVIEDELPLDAAEALERANGRRWVEALPPLAETAPTEA